MNSVSKICTRCNEDKTLEYFNIFAKGLHGRRSICKVCRHKYDVARRRTQRGLSFKIYYNQVKSCKRRNMDLPTYTKEELYEWLINDINFEELYKNWVQSDFSTKLVPSVDRLDNKLSYTFNNIQLVTWEENNRLGRSNRP